MLEKTAIFVRDLKSAARSLAHAKGLVATVIVTLALGIGGNAAMFSLVRGVLLRPLVNRDEGRLIYIRQTMNGDNARFSVPEIDDLRARVKTLSAIGDFSTIGFTMAGLGEPRSVQAGVVGGSYFHVMGLRPVLGRLLDPHDDGPNAAGAVVLTYRFWSTALKSDPGVLGKVVRLSSFIDTRPATVVGVLEPCVPCPQDTEIIANIVTSAHHLSATMVTGRIHRMTELFGRLAPGADLQTARNELDTVYRSMKREHPEAYPAKEDFHVSATRLRDELTSGARTILLVLFAASVLVFIIACSNVANLILARTMRRERELGIRAALGASMGALRRTLLAESLLLCGAGAAAGILIARPLVRLLAQYAARYSVRALDLTVDSSMLWVAGGLAVAAAVLLAYVPRLPSAGAAQGLAAGSARVTGSTNRRLRVFALVQIAASFVLVAAAATTVKTLLSLELVRTGFDTQHVLAVNVPVVREGKTFAQTVDYYREAARQIRELPGVVNVSVGSAVPWRDRSDFYPFEFAADGHKPAPGEEHPRAGFEVISPGYFATLGLPVLDGRDFRDGDRSGAEAVAIVSETLARRIFPDGHALNHYLLLTDPVLQFAPPPFKPEPTRIIGIVPDIDNTNLQPQPTMTIYYPADQEPLFAGGRLLVNTRTDPHGLVKPITAVLHKLSADQPVEHAATLEEIRAEVLSPERVNVIVSSAFAAVALLIAVVGVAGVLAFSVSGRTREFGIRLAVGSQPRNLLMRVIAEGVAIAIGGLAVGFAGGYWLAQLAGSFLGDLKVPGVLPVAGSALVLLIAAVTASAIPAARAARIDVIQALRTE
ncbi:MAG TPA: ADOP family duplicated permease [Bryobacteraceae bacterium]|jgi:predicted permease|nr:ADOP family duplicated permease [Bryobacteraceae bacterium]